MKKKMIYIEAMLLFFAPVLPDSPRCRLIAVLPNHPPS